MRTEKIKLYTFDELDEEAKQKVIEKFSDINVDYEWHDWILEEETARLATLGYEGAEIAYSGFYSQGDGASFTAQIDLDKWLRGRKIRTKYKKIAENNEEIDANVFRNSSHYVHEYTVDVELSPNYYSEIEFDQNKLNELTELIREDVRDNCNQIYRRLQKEYEYQTSEDAIVETIRANDYEFLAGGQLWR
jgi:hypothetical protein